MSLRGRGASSSRGRGDRDDAAKKRRDINKDDIIDTRPGGGAVSKKAQIQTTDVRVKVLTNYFRVRKKNFTIMQWSLAWRSDMEDLNEQTGRKRFLLLQHRDKFPEFIFTGDTMFTTSRIPVILRHLLLSLSVFTFLTLSLYVHQ